MIGRRQFVKVATSAVTANAFGLSRTQSPAPRKLKARIGTSPNSWGVWFATDPLQLPWWRFLDEAAEAGYAAIELGPYGYLPSQQDALKAELSKRGLQLTAGYVRAHLEVEAAWPGLEHGVNESGKLLASQGAKFLILIDDTHDGYFTGPPSQSALLDTLGWNRLIKTLNRVGDLARENFGLRLLIHPHAYSHIETPEQIEALLAETDAASVSLCLDTGHFAFRGGDPVDFLRRHHGRIAYLHLQSINPPVVKQWLAGGNGLFVNAVGMGVFCEPDKGNVDFATLDRVLNEVGFDGWAIVEQEMYPAAYDEPLPIAKRSLSYLRRLGWG
jgi:inosose dehydratase